MSLRFPKCLNQLFLSAGRINYQPHFGMQGTLINFIYAETRPLCCRQIPDNLLYTTADIMKFTGYCAITILHAFIFSHQGVAQPSSPYLDQHTDVIKARASLDKGQYDSAIFYNEKASAHFFQKKLWREYIYCKTKAGAYGNYLGGTFTAKALSDLKEALYVLEQNSFQADKHAAS